MKIIVLSLLLLFLSVSMFIFWLGLCFFLVCVVCMLVIIVLMISLVFLLILLRLVREVLLRCLSRIFWLFSGWFEVKKLSVFFLVCSILECD